MMLWIILGIIALIAFLGIRIVDQTEKAAIETFGKYSRFAEPGITWIIPIVQSMRKVNVTERMSNIEPQDIITKDNLNAKVDLVVFFKIQSDESSIRKALYSVNDVVAQIDTFARTTARNVIGNMEFKKVNSERNELNESLQESLSKQTKNWGIEITRVELKEIAPPRDVQDTMNKVIKAQNEKEAAVDTATALETEADGFKRAEIKKAEGIKQSAILEAQGRAEAIKLVNESAEKYFKGNAQVLRKIEMTQAFSNNSTVVVTKDGINPNIFLGEIPVKEKIGKKESAQ